jgi:hypothetical protein
MAQLYFCIFSNNESLFWTLFLHSYRVFTRELGTIVTLAATLFTFTKKYELKTDEGDLKFIVILCFAFH